MASAEAVARYFLWLAAGEPEDDPVTHMRLQKLLYYAQGWALGSLGRALFDSAIEAWQHGPVVRDVYRVFAPRGRDPIPLTEGSGGGALNEDEKFFVEGVWAEYRRYSASELWRMTHAEPPWLNARRGLGADEPARAPISDADMREHFRKLQRDRCRRAGIDPDQWEAAREDARAGRTIPLDQVIAELRGDVAH